jgi:hypothetical protein
MAQTSSSPGLAAHRSAAVADAGNRSGSFGISQNAIDALLFGGLGSAVAPGLVSVAGCSRIRSSK